MRIIYFNYLYDVHGASIGSVIKPIELFAALEKLGHQVKMCWMKEQPDDKATSPANAGARNFLKRYLARYVHDPKLFFENYAFKKKEAQVVEAFEPDLIVARLDLYLYSAINTARTHNVPIIIEADSPPVFEAVEFQKQYLRISKIPQEIERWVLHNADFSVMQSNALQKYFVERHDLDPAKTAVVTNGADVEKFSQNGRYEMLIRKYQLRGKPVLGFVGSMSAWHGVENLKRIILEVLRKYRHTKFLLVGTGGGQEADIRRFIAENELQENVELTGYVPYAEIPKYVSLMDIVLAPYPKLNFFYYSPVKLFEYMAAAKPVVTTDIGQIAEVVTNGQDGILCSADDFDEIIQSIFHLLRNPEERQRIGKNARKTITEKHTWMEKAREWEDICMKVLEKKKRMMNG